MLVANAMAVVRVGQLAAGDRTADGTHAADQQIERPGLCTRRAKHLRTQHRTTQRSEVASAEVQQCGLSSGDVVLLKQVGCVRDGGGGVIGNSGDAERGSATNHGGRKDATFDFDSNAGDVVDAFDVHRVVEELAVGHQDLLRTAALGDQTAQF